MNKPDTKKTGAVEESETDSGFLARWSRRKAEARQAPPPGEQSESQKIEPQAPEPDDAPVDPATLPSIDSLTAESDFTVFLRKGVPEELRRAALHKLWRTEPSVVNYVPLVEYNWDFNAPDYGVLKATDDIAKLARTILGGSTEDVKKAPLTADAPASGTAAPITSTASDSERSQVVNNSPQRPESEPEKPKSTPVRRHGGALPT